VFHDPAASRMTAKVHEERSALQTIEILERLVAFPTVSAASSLELIAFVEAVLQEAGFDCRRFADATGRKAALFGSLGPSDVPGLLLSAHSDVVPVEGQSWASDPFHLTERGGRLYARGSTDMKGFLASMVSAAVRARHRPLSAPLQLAISYDEEIGCVGVRPMLDELVKIGLKPKFCLIGEPTTMRIATGHKGKLALRAVCRGVSAHSASAPLALNAIQLASDLVVGIRDIQAQIEATGAHDPGYDVPYTTLHVGTISGGTSLNIVPDQAVLEFEIRHLAGDDANAIVGAVVRKATAIVAPHLVRFPDAAIDIEIRNRYPGLDMPDDCDTVNRMQAILGKQAESIKVAFGTEAGLFHERLGVPAVVCGPGSMEQGHRADEFVETAQLAHCDQFLERLIDGIARS
jgi:acetylornithine deacetylase